MDGNQLSHGLGLLLSWSLQVSQGPKTELCVLQPSLEPMLRASNLQYRGWYLMRTTCLVTELC